MNLRAVVAVLALASFLLDYHVVAGLTRYYGGLGENLLMLDTANRIGDSIPRRALPAGCSRCLNWRWAYLR